MVVRIRLHQGRSVRRTAGGKNRSLALAVGALLAPATLMAYVLGLWRLLADLRVLQAFPIHDGFFSHWQVWFPIAAALHYAAFKLDRYGRQGEFRWPRLPWRLEASESGRSR